MKAKEYFQKHVAHLPRQINGHMFSKVMAASLNELFAEVREMIKPLKQEASQLAKIREAQKKWVAYATLCKAHFETPDHYRRPIGNDDALIDKEDLVAMGDLFNYILQKEHSYIHQRLHETTVARDRLQHAARPQFAVMQDDALWRGLVAVCRGF